MADIYAALALSNARIARTPGASAIQRSHGGLPFSGVSGITPFVRTNSGHILAPGIQRRGIAKFFTDTKIKG